jgi:hypothetical protein
VIEPREGRPHDTWDGGGGSGARILDGNRWAGHRRLLSKYGALPAVRAIARSYSSRRGRTKKLVIFAHPQRQIGLIAVQPRPGIKPPPLTVMEPPPPPAEQPWTGFEYEQRLKDPRIAGKAILSDFLIVSTGARLNPTGSVMGVYSCSGYYQVRLVKLQTPQGFPGVGLLDEK